MTEGTILVLMALFAVLLPRIIHAHRRTHWRRASACVDASYFEVQGKNAHALVDLSWDDAGQRRTATRIPSGRLDVAETPPGSTLFILVDPAKPARCVVDEE